MVAGYRVYRDGVLVATLTKTRWVDGLPLSGTRLYDVLAFDAADNIGPAAVATVQ